jgi:hypothetical protein
VDPRRRARRSSTDLARIGAVADLIGTPAAAVLDSAALTSAAGLVLLYPWLSDHLRAAEALHPRLDPAPVRARALEAVLGWPSEGGQDPLIALLAGMDSPAAVGPLVQDGLIVDSAHRILQSFAALLPGFAASSPGFVQREWISRLGVIDTDQRPILLTAATRPLDLVLDALPYPLGLIALPWCPPISVRFRP